MKIGVALRYEIEQTFAVVHRRSTAEELVFVCPECGDKTGNRSVNLRTGMTFCWRCGKGKNNKGSFLEWARALGYQFRAEAPLNSASADPFFVETSTGFLENVEVPVIQEIQLPEGFTPIARDSRSCYSKLITKMARRKNLDYEDFVEANVGYTKEDVKWEPYAIFPVYEYAACAYFQGRTYVDVPGQPTKRFPSRLEVPYGSKYWVYNIDAAREPGVKLVVVVESILNVLSLKRKFRELGWEKEVVPVGVFKHNLSSVQTAKLLRIGNIQEICILYDRDATAHAWQQALRLANFKKTSVAEMPKVTGKEKLDPNDDVDAAIRALDGRRGCSSEMLVDWQTRFQKNLSDIRNVTIGS